MSDIVYVVIDYVRGYDDDRILGISTNLKRAQQMVDTAKPYDDSKFVEAILGKTIVIVKYEIYKLCDMKNNFIKLILLPCSDNNNNYTFKPIEAIVVNKKTSCKFLEHCDMFDLTWDKGV